MSLEDLRKKIKRKMSEEDKKKLIAELRQEILRICPWTYDPVGDEEAIRRIAENNERLMKKVRENKKEHLIADKGFPDYPINDLSKVDDKNLTKQELLENLGCMIMQDLFKHPFIHLRLRFLNACEVWRRENKEAKEKGLPLPHKDECGFFEVEPMEHKLERCFGICKDKNRRF